MTGIPDPGGVSGTFRALERTSPIVQMADGIATTTSMRVANGTDNEHRAVLQLIGDNMADFEEFGRVASEMQPFDTAGGVQHRRVYILNEEHATLLLTYMRNNEVVKDFKKRLVREFYLMRAKLATPLTDDEIVHQALAITARRIGELTERIAELEPKAEFFDELMDSDGTYSMGAVANMLHWGRNVMFRELRRSGVLQGNNLPYQRYAHHFKVVPGTFVNRDGETIPTATTKVLPSGIDFLRKKLDRSLVVTS